MKLIIDIHEEQYEFLKQGVTFAKVTKFPALMKELCEHIAHGTPLDTVKAEIEQDGAYYQEIGEKERASAYLEILSTIDKCIDGKK